jgi:[acyl-carrier-protein] S-malonyltransferase
VSYGILFPGQGSQFVGMGAELFDARSALLGSRSDDILGWSLAQMCLEGPEDELTRTEHAQPALFALSYAMWDILNESLDTRPSGAAGHSLGEYTALCAAGVIDYDSALAAVSARGKAMAEAADSEDSGMAALIGADLELARSVVERRSAEGGRLELANINAPGQIVVAGSAVDIDWLSENSRDLGVRRVIPLKVAGAFHSSFMESAADEVGKALAELDIAQPAFPVWSNTTAKPHDVADVRRLLRDQLVSTVRFSESLSDMAASGIDTFVHVGPGDVTAGMARRTVSDAKVLVVSKIDEIDEAAGSLGTMT